MCIRDSHYLGMREDVVQALEQLQFKGPLRYPGGCYASVSGPWTDGLLPADLRPTRFTSPDHCPAVAGGVNAYTDGMMVDGIGIDDYMQLARRIGAEPAITIKLQYGTADEIDTAATWVEYCNGDLDTKWGAVRASRGHIAPYNVKIWYLGNEIANQHRFPNYPAENKFDLSPTAPQYAAMLSSIIPALLAKDPQLEFIVVGAGGQAPWSPGWDQDYVQAVGSQLTAASWHAGYGAQPAPSGWTADAVATSARWPSIGFEPSLVDIRTSLNTSGANIAISADEWGLSPWTTNTYSTAHGVYAASFLSVIAGPVGQRHKVELANYFEPINEGAIQVGPFNAILTPVGQVFGVYAAHQGQDSVAFETPLPLAGDSQFDLEALASMSDTADVLLTLVNRNTTTDRAVVVNLVDFPVASLPAAVDIAVLTASSFAMDSTFASSTASTQLAQSTAGATMTVHVPAFSVIQCKVKAKASAN
eukprot:TRINITY_DN5032_c0_g1_i2.p1 TRINITY_DN5032_c0_g1~~TRINITY_DN5032_c0_g1_i2.p1  ORF type:complete len:508 (-),score=95.63 TRINITY_DN5032_c0_g1_i2:172-1596(-)